MKLKSFNYFFGLLIVLTFFSPLKGEDKIDIWKNNKNKKQIIKNKDTINKKNSQKLKSITSLDSIQNIKIEDEPLSKNI